MNCSLHLEIANVVVPSVISPLSLVGNGLALVAISCVDRPLRPLHVLLISLCVSDIIGPLAYLTGKVVQLCGSCGATFLRASLQLSTIVHLIAMAYDNYIAVCKPLHYFMILKPTRVKCMVITIWSVCIGFGLFFVVTGFLGVAIYKVGYCDAFTKSISFLYIVPSVLLAMSVLFSLCVFYVKIFLAVRRSNKVAHSLPLAEGSSVNVNAKASITTLVIIGKYIILVTPTAVATLVRVRGFLEPAQWLFLTSHVINPIIYAARMPDIRQGFLRVYMTCCSCIGKSSRDNNFLK